MSPAVQYGTPTFEDAKAGAASQASLESPEKAKASSSVTETDLYQAIRLQLDQYRKPTTRER